MTTKSSSQQNTLIDRHALSSILLVRNEMFLSPFFIVIRSSLVDVDIKCLHCISCLPFIFWQKVWTKRIHDTHTNNSIVKFNSRKYVLTFRIG